jgi:hypothetical protein
MRVSPADGRYQPTKNTQHSTLNMVNTQVVTTLLQKLKSEKHLSVDLLNVECLIGDIQVLAKIRQKRRVAQTDYPIESIRNPAVPSESMFKLSQLISLYNPLKSGV